MVLEDLEGYYPTSRVLLDIDSYEETKEKSGYLSSSFSGMKEPWNSMEKVAAYITIRERDGSLHLVVPADENDVDEEWESMYARGDVIEPASSYLQCDGCYSELLYHDRKETYICPFCNKNEEINE